MMHGGGWGWGAWLAMSVLVLGVASLAVWAVVTAARGPGRTPARGRSADEILAERFARGEIDQDEFTTRRDALHSRR